MLFQKVLVVDDELIIRKSLQEVCYRRRIPVKTVGTVNDALNALKKDPSFDLMFLDINLPDGKGTDVLHGLSGMENMPVTIVITGQGSIESAVECMKAGAYDYITKPFSVSQIEMVVDKAGRYRRLLQFNQELSLDSSREESPMVYQSDCMKQLLAMVDNVARTDATVLICGETGTGKELIAQRIHRSSPRSSKPFVKVNCAAISESLMESEFFGHEKGAFTGAMTSRIGRFELADGGTILLDEISEISPALQAKLLRVLQERELERVGGERVIKIDVRVVATTNRDLLDYVEQGKFRKDLYYRLNVFPVHSPPLRERGQDVLLLADAFRLVFMRKHGCKVDEISPEAKRLLMSYPWPGNVRELQNVIERAVILSNRKRQIMPDALPLELRMQTPPVQNPEKVLTALQAEVVTNSSLMAKGSAEGFSLHTKDRSLAAIEKQLILDTLQSTGGNRTATADLIGVSIRTLRNKIAQYKAEGDAAFELY